MRRRRLDVTWIMILEEREPDNRPPAQSGQTCGGRPVSFR